jgi:hypothetical protein
MTTLTHVQIDAEMVDTIELHHECESCDHEATVGPSFFQYAGNPVCEECEEDMVITSATVKVPANPNDATTRVVVPGAGLEPGDVLIGGAEGTTLIESVSESSAMPGLLVVETEHGSLYLDPDIEYMIKSRS